VHRLTVRHDEDAGAMIHDARPLRSNKVELEQPQYDLSKD
jgi:hypothetical protein